MADRFPSPFEMPTPPGAEGWQDLYAYSSVFSEDRREYEESAFWFMDGVHSPEVIPPWDATIVEYALIALSQYNTRHYVIPPARGVDMRFLNGYMYLSPVGVTDPRRSRRGCLSSPSGPGTTSPTGSGCTRRGSQGARTHRRTRIRLVLAAP